MASQTLYVHVESVTKQNLFEYASLLQEKTDRVVDNLAFHADNFFLPVYTLSSGGAGEAFW